MQDTISCHRCNSARVMRDVALGGTTTISIAKTPGSVSLRNQKTLRATVCADCGHVDLSTLPHDREALWDRYVKLRLGGVS